MSQTTIPRTEASRPAWRSLPRNVWVVTATSFLTDVSSNMLFDLMPLFLANVLGVKTNVIGLIEGIAETTASLLKIFSGWLSDRLRARKWLTVAGYGLSTVAKPFLYIVTSWWGVLAVRVTDRIGKGIRTAPRDALVAASIDADHRGLAFGLHRMGDTLGAATGILIALLIVLATQAGGLTLSRETFQVVVIASIIPAVLAVIVLAAGAQDVPVTSQAEAPRLTLRGFDRRFYGFLLAVTVFTLGNSADAFLILRAQERGLTVAGVMGMVLTFNLIYALISGPAGVLSDRIGRYRLIVGGWLVYGLLYLGFALVEQAWQMWALYGLYGIYYGAVEGNARALVADLVPEEKRGTAYGVYNAAVGVLALPASVIAGLLWSGIGGWAGFGPRAPFLFGAVLALIAVILLRIGLTPPADDR
ncbi:MAG: MFS transporter [Anaerolineae bacterium]|nr:MFS transporter [Anaerolineae bacterium]